MPTIWLCGDSWGFTAVISMRHSAGGIAQRYISTVNPPPS